MRNPPYNSHDILTSPLEKALGTGLGTKEQSTLDEF